MRFVIFDCDGTLVDSSKLIVDAMSRGFRENGHDVPDAHDIRNIVGLSLTGAIARLAPALDFDDYEKIGEAYKAAYADLRTNHDYDEPLYPGALACLDHLKNDPAVVMGVATGKSRKGLNFVIEAHDLQDYFHSLQCADDNPSKPDPTMLEKAMLDVGATPENSVIIGDTSFDIEMGVNAGIATIGVSWGNHAVDRLEQAGADAIVATFDELGAVLDQLLAVSL